MSTTRLMGNPAGMTTLMTVGHGSLERGALVRLLTEHDVELLVDVRRYPGSRRNPQTKPDALKESLTRAGIDYRWDERLGGRRRLASDSRDTWWEVDQFRAYAGWTRTPDFAAGLRELLAEATERRTAIMCAEAVWWRCHRRLIADFLTLARATPVRHLDHDGRTTRHPVAAGARRTPDGVLVYDRT